MHTRLIIACLGLAFCPVSVMANAKVGERKAELCVLCHKPSTSFSATPLLEGLPAAYLVAAITAYKSGVRKDPMMNANARNLSDRDIRDIADYLSSRPPFTRPPQTLDEHQIKAGEARVSQKQCASCHQASFRGDQAAPRLAGQTHHYLINQLQAFASGARQHPYKDMPATRSDIEDVAGYLASLP